MNSTTRLQLLALSFLGLVASAPLAAQTRLYIEESDGKFHAVFRVKGSVPYIKENGQLVAARGQRFALKPVDEFLPAFVNVHDLEAGSSNLHLAATDTHLNNQFRFSANFESEDALDDVFAVLELEISNVGKRIFAFEVGRIEPGKPKPLSVEMSMGQYLGGGQLQLHLFVGGTEIFQSEQPADFRAAKLNEMIARRIAGVQQAGPQPFFGSSPKYPAALRQSGLKGEAVVTIRIDAQGAVQEAVLDRASEPPFGEAALAAVRQWRFLPRVKDGVAVESKVSVPIGFEPPAAGK